ncbi:MAG: protein kinase [Myxococcales bacterium]|nr:protein kinase [Myxococcales bacterium]
MGIVYRASHLALQEEVALKVLRRDVSLDDETVLRFTREAQAAVKLKSEHVTRIKDVGALDDGLPYIVMELLHGADLGAMVDMHGAMAAPVAVDLVLQACDAIAEAHSLGIVHRDVKPTNLFVSFRPDQSAIVKVLDFGISKSANGSDLSLTQTQSMLGTPAYMSPEQMRSARMVDARTDIWSLGTVLFELVEARRPFEAASFSEMCVMVAVDPPQPMQRAPELAIVIGRCLEKQPADRYPHVAELMRDLAPFAASPDAAHHQVRRAYRMLGLPVPRQLESSPALRVGPVPGPTPNAVHDAGTAAMALAHPTPPPMLRSDAPTEISPPPIELPPRRWPIIIGVVAVLVGIAGGAWFATRGKDTATAHAGSASGASDAGSATAGSAPTAPVTSATAGASTTAPATSATAGSGTTTTTTTATAASAATAGSDAGSATAGVEAEPATSAAVEAPPAAKLPAKPAVRPAIRTKPPARRAVKPRPPEAPPKPPEKPKFDPFANPGRPGQKSS